MSRMMMATFAVLLTLDAGAAQPEDPCSKSSWKIDHERALFAGPAADIGGAADSASAPVIGLDKAYQMRLIPEDRVQFAAPRAIERVTGGGYAGLAKFRVKRAGRYRISVDLPFWIDVIADGKLIKARDYQGQEGCNAPHKIVEYDLPAGRELILQLSGASDTQVRVTLTATPRKRK